MSDVILTNWTIFYDETPANSVGFKQLRWTGTTGSNTMNELYSEVIHFFNDPETQTLNDDFQNTTPMNAVTPTEYEIGAFDAEDANPWFIDPESIKHLTGGSLKTVGWTRTVGTAAGIIKVPYDFTSTNFVSTDLGRKVVVATDLDEGTLLYFESSGTSGTFWVRPDTNTSTDNFDNTPTAGAAVSVTGGTAVDVTMGGVAITGEMTWSNIFTIGSIKAGTQLYITQSDALISNTEDSGSGAWWGTDQIDVLILTTDQDTLIDKGLITVYGRDYGDLYDHFQVDAGAGGRNPVPMSVTADANNNVSQATANGYGLLFAYSANLVEDMTDGGGSQPYDVTVSKAAGTLTVQEIYEGFKEHTRFGETGDIDTSGSEVAIPGEQYKGQEVHIEYTLGTTFTIPASGTVVTGSVSGATADLIGQDNVGTLFLSLSNVKGTFTTSDTITQSPGSGTTASVVAVINTTLQKTSPLGTFAGGQLFCAQGVFLDFGMLGAGEGAKYEVIDNNGVTRTQPVTRSFQITGAQAGSELRMFTDDGLRTEITSPESPSPGIEESTEFINAATDITIVNGGSSYVTGDILTLTSGTGTAVVFTITATAGAVDGISALGNGGLYTVKPTTSAHTNGGEGGGSGTNATFTFKFASTPFLFQYIFASDTAAYAQVMHTLHPYIKISDIVLGDADQSIPVQQTVDRTYI